MGGLGLVRHVSSSLRPMGSSESLRENNSKPKPYIFQHNLLPLPPTTSVPLSKLLVVYSLVLFDIVFGRLVSRKWPQDFDRLYGVGTSNYCGKCIEG